MKRRNHAVKCPLCAEDVSDFFGGAPAVPFSTIEVCETPTCTERGKLVENTSWPQWTEVDLVDSEEPHCPQCRKFRSVRSLKFKNCVNQVVMRTQSSVGKLDWRNVSEDCRGGCKVVDLDAQQSYVVLRVSTVPKPEFHRSLEDADDHPLDEADSAWMAYISQQADFSWPSFPDVAWPSFSEYFGSSDYHYHFAQPLDACSYPPNRTQPRPPEVELYRPQTRPNQNFQRQFNQQSPAQEQRCHGRPW